MRAVRTPARERLLGAMSHEKTIFVLLCALVLVAGTLTTASPDTCWNDRDNENGCRILATLFGGTLSDGIAMEIGCDEVAANETDGGSMVDAVPPTNELSSIFVTRRFENAQRVVLNGCHTSLTPPTMGTTSYGIEFLPHCDKLVVVTIERFHMDVLQPLQCRDTHTGPEVLTFRYNEIATIAADSLDGQQHLRELHLEGNSLRHIDRRAFDVLRAVEVIRVENEPLLAIKGDTSDLFVRTGALALRLVTLRRIAAALFTQLPDSLRHLRVERTAVEGDVIAVSNPQMLLNVSAIGCALNSFHLHDPHATVLHLNLSGNALVDFRAVCGGALAGDATSSCAVDTLDLSENALTALPVEWLGNLSRLGWISLRGNLLHVLAVPAVLGAAPATSLIDLRGNQFTCFDDSGVEHLGSDLDRLRIRIDGNPWDCVWLLEFAHSWPERFRLFQYEKFISKINVNGLECTPPQASLTTATATATPQVAPFESASTRPNEAPHVTSDGSPMTLLHPNQWDIKRSQRAEALIIVFMLPLGIAFLFLLLYMWIYCQKMFHLSYYRSFPFLGRRHISPTSADRFDVVRHLPPSHLTSGSSVTFAANNNDGYEAPMNGVVSACNCSGMGPQTPAAQGRCEKAHHITYEAIPPEQPYKIYEEILEEDQLAASSAYCNGAPSNARPSHQFYDHLSYSE